MWGLGTTELGILGVLVGVLVAAGVALYRDRRLPPGMRGRWSFWSTGILTAIIALDFSFGGQPIPGFVAAAGVLVILFAVGLTEGVYAGPIMALVTGFSGLLLHNVAVVVGGQWLGILCVWASAMIAGVVLIVRNRRSVLNLAHGTLQNLGVVDAAVVPLEVECTCHACGVRLRIPARYAGTTGTCKQCGARVTSPEILPHKPRVAAVQETAPSHVDFASAEHGDNQRPRVVSLRDAVERYSKVQLSVAKARGMAIAILVMSLLFGCLRYQEMTAPVMGLGKYNQAVKVDVGLPVGEAIFWASLQALLFSIPVGGLLLVLHYLAVGQMLGSAWSHVSKNVQPRRGASAVAQGNSSEHGSRRAALGNSNLAALTLCVCVAICGLWWWHDAPNKSASSRASLRPLTRNEDITTTLIDHLSRFENVQGEKASQPAPSKPQFVLSSSEPKDTWDVAPDEYGEYLEISEVRVIKDEFGLEVVEGIAANISDQDIDSFRLALYILEYDGSVNLDSTHEFGDLKPDYYWEFRLEVVHWPFRASGVYVLVDRLTLAAD